MAEAAGDKPPTNFSSEERQLYARVFSACDTDSLGVVTGDTALNFFPQKTKLPSEVLGEIWQIADTEDKGFVTPASFSTILRLIGYAQAGQPISAELAKKAGGPLPKFEGINTSGNVQAAALLPQNSGGPIRVPPLLPDKATQYAALFEESGAVNGALPGPNAKAIFDRAQLPNDILARIWNLSDTESRGKLSVTEFIIAMHLLASYRGGNMRGVPQTLPVGLYEAAARRGVPVRQGSGSRPTSDVPVAAQRQIGGIATQRTSSPLTRGSYGAIPPQSTGSPGPADWAVALQEKAQYDMQFDKLDTNSTGHLTGDQAVTFFSASGLPEDDLAQIWDLSDINSEGQLNKDEFAVAMHLIRGQITKRGPLPQVLPPNLVPPNMRKRPVAPQQSTAPTFDTANVPPKQKSAAEDLFGLDSLTDQSAAPAQPQAPQSTGSSAKYTPISPQATGSQAPGPFAQAQQRSQPATQFRPFVPDSSFGRSIMTPQATGTSTSTSPGQARAAPASDDLLGDTDPEVSKKLTNDTSDLANLSNQVTTLTNQMQDVRNKRGSTERDLTQVNNQKREFETRLGQLRTAYEQEAREVKAIEEQLATSRQKCQKKQQDLAMIMHSLQTLQEQHQQFTAALDADKKENATLSERIGQVNREIEQLKPQVEKAKSDARHQKGRVAINKKQLSTNESERDRLRSELETATSDHQGALRELEESQKQLEESHRQLQEGQRALAEQQQAAEQSKRSVEESKRSLPASPAPVGSPNVTSPSGTITGSMNPFFRRTTTSGSERSKVVSPEATGTPSQNAFDSFFGPSVPAPSPFSPFGSPPATSFGKAEPTASAGSTEGSRDEPADMPLSPNPDDPPPPPQSRQITSNFLPFPKNLPKSDSPTSSTGVAPPTSRFGDTTPGFNTPTAERAFSGQHPAGLRNMEEISRSPTPTPGESVRSAFDEIQPEDTAQAVKGISDKGDGFDLPSTSHDIPGAFPGEPNDSKQHFAPWSADADPDLFNPPAGSSRAGREDPFASQSQEKPKAASGEDDFGSTFENLEESNPDTKTPPVQLNASQSEFPPIREFDRDSDSDSEAGFDDDFAAKSPVREAAPVTPAPPVASFAENASATDVLDAERAKTDPPPIEAQNSPPTYGETMSPNGTTHRDPNQFAEEYRGILPSREAPDAPSTIQASAGTAPSPPHESMPSMPLPMPAGSTAAPYAYDNREAEAAKGAIPSLQQPPPPPPKQPVDDFDADFADLSEAQAADDKADDDIGTMHRSDYDDTFNPSFDSPAPSKASTMPYRPSIPENDSKPQQPQTASNEDWDTLFAGLGNAKPQANGNASMIDEAFGGPVQPPPGPPPGRTAQSTKPVLGRALTDGTDHDDPILKRLTGMGYPREKSLAALEKFDYNLDKAADWLTSNS